MSSHTAHVCCSSASLFDDDVVAHSSNPTARDGAVKALFEELVEFTCPPDPQHGEAPMSIVRKRAVEVAAALVRVL